MQENPTKPKNFFREVVFPLRKGGSRPILCVTDIMQSFKCTLFSGTWVSVRQSLSVIAEKQIGKDPTRHNYIEISACQFTVEWAATEQCY